MYVNNSKYISPFMLEKIYGGEIMAHSLIEARKEVDKSFYLISFTTHYFFALHSKKYSYKCINEGGGQNLKFLRVEIEQENKVCVRTEFIFSKKEKNEINFKTNIKKSENDILNKSEKKIIEYNYSDFFTDAIINISKMSKEHVLEMYNGYLCITKYFEKRSNLKIIDESTIYMEFNNIESIEEFYLELAFVSDFILIQCVGNLLKFELHDFKKYIIFSLKQSMSFSEKIDFKSKCILKINLEILNSCKALVKGILLDKQNQNICSLEQIVLFRIRK